MDYDFLKYTDLFSLRAHSTIQEIRQNRENYRPIMENLITEINEDINQFHLLIYNLMVISDQIILDIYELGQLEN